MRAIHVADLDKRRPAVVLTREGVRDSLRSVTLATITTRIRGLAVEVSVDARNGLENRSVINCDKVVTVPAGRLGPRIGSLLPDQEPELAAALLAAFDLRV